MNPNLEEYFKAAEEWKATLANYELTKFYSQVDRTADKVTGDSEGQARSKELYAIIRSLVEGEARTVIKNATDGFQAWQALHRIYSRQTLARPYESSGKR